MDRLNFHKLAGKAYARWKLSRKSPGDNHAGKILRHKDITQYTYLFEGISEAIVALGICPTNFAVWSDCEEADNVGKNGEFKDWHKNASMHLHEKWAK